MLYLVLVIKYKASSVFSTCTWALSTRAWNQSAHTLLVCEIDLLIVWQCMCLSYLEWEYKCRDTCGWGSRTICWGRLPVSRYILCFWHFLYFAGASATQFLVWNLLPEAATTGSPSVPKVLIYCIMQQLNKFNSWFSVNQEMLSFNKVAVHAILALSWWHETVLSYLNNCQIELFSGSSNGLPFSFIFARFIL